MPDSSITSISSFLYTCQNIVCIAYNHFWQETFLNFFLIILTEQKFIIWWLNYWQLATCKLYSCIGFSTNFKHKLAFAVHAVYFVQLPFAMKFHAPLYAQIASATHLEWHGRLWMNTSRVTDGWNLNYSCANQVPILKSLMVYDRKAWLFREVSKGTTLCKLSVSQGGHWLPWVYEVPPPQSNFPTITCIPDTG